MSADFGYPLTTAEDAVDSSGLNILVYGKGGAGKTHLARTTGCPDATLVVAAEPGLLTLVGSGVKVAIAKDFESLRDILKALRRGSAFEWVILDSLSEIAERCLVEELRKPSKSGEQRHGLAAYGETKDRMLGLVRAFRDLHCHVVMLCKMERTKDDQNRMMYGPTMPGRKLSEALPYLFDEVWALKVEHDVDGVPQRLLQTMCDHQYEAKDRSGKLAIYEEPDLLKLETKILSR